jgi:hypothetical protein
MVMLAFVLMFKDQLGTAELRNLEDEARKHGSICVILDLIPGLLT